MRGRRGGSRVAKRGSAEAGAKKGRVPALTSVGLPRREPKRFENFCLPVFEPERPCSVLDSAPDDGRHGVGINGRQGREIAREITFAPE